jgi:hypothetical protein
LQGLSALVERQRLQIDQALVLSAEPNAAAARSDPEAERGQRVSRHRVFEHGAKALQRGASEPRLGHDEIIVLILCRNNQRRLPFRWL